VLYNNSTYCSAPSDVYTLRAGGTTYVCDGYSFTVNGASNAGFIQNYDDQMPGDGMTPEAFDSSNIWLSGQWQAFGGSVYNSDPNAFTVYRANSSDVEAWDDKC
jgi:hypothetical protein